MRENRMIAYLGACFLAFFMVSAEASGGHGWGHGFTNKSLKGTYYIPCACEGNEVVSGGSIHSAGMGKIEFDGHGGATITQQNLYTEIGNKIVRVVENGKFLEGPHEGHPAQFSGSYDVNSEGYGLLFDGAFPPEDYEYPEYIPSFLITKAWGRKPIEIYLVLPQDFIGLTMKPTHLIHVTATRR